MCAYFLSDGTDDITHVLHTTMNDALYVDGLRVGQLLINAQVKLMLIKLL
jgi:hypothetical protein